MSVSQSQLDLAVSDIRQYVYCPRIPFFRLGLRLPHRFVTAGMQEGILQHQHTEDLEHRRTLHAYGLSQGERHFDVPMRSDQLGLGGRMDLVIRSPHEVIPVEFKNSKRLGLHHKYQLAAYALLAEAHFGAPVRRTFAYFIPLKMATAVDVTSGARRYVRRVLNAIRESVNAERVPEGTRVVSRCHVCEFLTYCNDRW
jgi:CRISPR-associated exonuclease Cas4